MFRRDLVYFSGAVVIALALPNFADAGRVVWPASGSISSPYGPRTSPCSGCSSFHQGIDIAIGTGTHLGSPGNGTVSSYTWSNCSGNMYVIGYGGGWESRFHHTSSSIKPVGSVVTRNVDVARSGGTGSCTTGPHLHLEIRKDGVHQYIPGARYSNVVRGSEIPQNYPGLNDVPPPQPDIPLVGDWNGDGVETVGIFRRGEWHLRNSNSDGPAHIVFVFGTATDRPVVGDWNGDGIDTIGVYRNGLWYIKNTNAGGQAEVEIAFGWPSDVPVVGDWDGNGTDNIGIRRGGEWHLKNTNVNGPAYTSFVFGWSSDIPVVGDWDGNGTDTVGIRRGNVWHLSNTNNASGAYTSFAYGWPTDVPVVGDWDGNGTQTVGIRRGNVWHLRNSNSAGGAFTSFAYGT